MNPEKVLRAYFNNKDYYPFDEKHVWVKNFDGWTMVPCPPELMYTHEDGLLEIILDMPDSDSDAESCHCEPKALLDFGCQCGGE